MINSNVQSIQDANLAITNLSNQVAQLAKQVKTLQAQIGVITGVTGTFVVDQNPSGTFTFTITNGIVKAVK